MVPDVFAKVIQIYTSIGLSYRLEVHFHHIKIPAGNGGVKTKGRSLEIVSVIKKITVVGNGAFLCFAHSLIIANGDPKYKSYRNGYGRDKTVDDLLNASEVDLTNSGGL